MELKIKKWYQKKRYLIPISILAVALLASANSNQTVNTSVQGQSSYTALATPATASYNNQDSNNLSNTNTYTNTYGNTVHSPAYSTDNSIPTGASAQCNDGTYSFSQSRRGTCSHHGGVSQWLQ